jgi:predicted DNA-binding protein
VLSARTAALRCHYFLEFARAISPSVDKRILARILIRVALARINLNVPPETRKRLQAVAKRLKKTESEVARDLLVEGLRRQEKAAFYERVSEQMTPELRARLLEIAVAFERLDG